MGLYYKGENIQGAVAEGGGNTYTKIFESVDGLGNFNGESTIDIPLLDSYKKYKFLRFYNEVNNGNFARYIVRDISTEQLDKMRLKNNSNDTVSMTWGYSSKNDYVDIIVGSEDNNLKALTNLTRIHKIEGYN